MNKNYYKHIYDLIKNKNPQFISYGGTNINKVDNVIKSIDTKISFNFKLEDFEINENIQHILSDPIDLRANSLLNEDNYRILTNKLIKFAKNHPIPQLTFENKKFKFYLNDLIKGDDEYGRPFIAISTTFKELISN
ncbi:hypothetical protein [Apilactobacillus kunkeei]|uniref:hypothetical protein n=1 Tax=Apilactobacillus kunkeei TaxID=148814 RepID=UPI00112A6E2B|nr:hypothetical protein [Apilactobacillus kunkeei]TPR53191.1 hypothetical protein DY036_07120 [Apilactobacillus kunkeei]